MMYMLRMVLLLVVLTGIVHIFAILAIPVFADQKVWARIVERTEPRELMVISDHDIVRALLGEADPAMMYGVCRFDLSEGAVSLAADGPTDFWNVTIFNQNAEMVYSLHDGVSQIKDLRLEITNLNEILRKRDEIEKNNVPKAAGKAADAKTPVPFSRPLTASQVEAEKARIVAIESEGSTVKAQLALDQGFLVMKLFKSSAQYNKLVTEALDSAECK